VRRPRRTAASFSRRRARSVYANGLTGDFTYDDKAVRPDNPRIRTPARLPEIFSTQYFGGPRGTGTAYRPVLLTSYALQWWIRGNDPIPFHVVNVLGHVAATLLLAALLRRLGFSPPVAVGAALLFAVHPIHVEAVTSIVGRGETQSAALTLGSCFSGCVSKTGEGVERRPDRSAVASTAGQPDQGEHGDRARAPLSLSRVAGGGRPSREASPGASPRMGRLCRFPRRCFGGVFLLRRWILGAC